MKIIMGTGSRSVVKDVNARGIYSVTEQYLVGWHQLEPDGILLITGMAEGWDEIIAKVGLRNNIPYDAYIPTKNYGEYYWGKKSLLGRNRMATWYELVDGARRVTYLEDIYGSPRMMRKSEIDKYTIAGPNYFINGIWLHANFARNEVMAQNSDMAVVYDAGSSGTRDAVTRLRELKKPMRFYPFAA